VRTSYTCISKIINAYSPFSELLSHI